MNKNILKILLFGVFVAGSIFGSFAQEKNTPYELVIDGDGFAFFGGDNYAFISVFLNNNTNEPLYYAGTDCDNLMFSLKKNVYFHIANDICRSSIYSRMVLPPHRSQKMIIYLTHDKEPDQDISLDISMKLYKWSDNKNEQEKTNEVMGKLSDTIVLHYNSNHQEYYAYESAENYKKKQERILPGKDIYLLTDADLKLYTLTVENSDVGPPRDNVMSVFRDKKSNKGKVVTVPVILHNNSPDKLRFYSMTCSWGEFWGTNKDNIQVPGQLCDKNIPEIITVDPYGVYKKDVELVYDSNAQANTKYKISLSLSKIPRNREPDYGFHPNEYTRFNKIWTDEITIR